MSMSQGILATQPTAIEPLLRVQRYRLRLRSRWLYCLDIAPSAIRFEMFEHGGRSGLKDGNLAGSAKVERR